MQLCLSMQSVNSVHRARSQGQHTSIAIALIIVRLPSLDIFNTNSKLLCSCLYLKVYAPGPWEFQTTGSTLFSKVPIVALSSRPTRRNPRTVNVVCTRAANPSCADRNSFFSAGSICGSLESNAAGSSTLLLMVVVERHAKL